ncbi:MAG: hypothetical protein HZA28_03875 [Candidatus Omnitrophica bacterium]|nr:hypothetical protein [Candidatus Omnitrophota bacterium]
MKKFFPIFFCLAVCASQLCVLPASGESPQEILATGLKGLKESYNHLVERNNFLAAEIASYRRDSPSLSKRWEALVSQKEALMANKRAEENSGDQTDVLEVYRQELDRLRRQLEAADESDQQKIFLREKEGLENLIQGSRENASAAQLRLRDVGKEYDQQAGTMARLRKKQQSFNRQVSKTAGDFGRDKKSVVEAHPQIVADENSALYLAKLTDEISQLKAYRQQLDNKILNRRSRDPGETMEWGEEQYQTYRKLYSLREENMLLKRQLFSIGSDSSTGGQAVP